MKIQISWKYPENEYGKIINLQYLKWVNRIGLIGSYEDGDILLLIGGADIGTNPERDAHELKLIDKYIEQGKPIFGICRGMQLLGLRYNLNFIKHIPELDTHINHLSSSDGWKGDSSFHKIKNNLGQSFIVNSRHHQGFLKSESHNLFLTEWAWSEDCIIEAIRGNDYSTYFSGVQFHPEREEVWDTDSEILAINEIRMLIKMCSTKA
jgi:gamma-glutamyl-gamma-aminobutyrate hydrolase PuuD